MPSGVFWVSSNPVTESSGVWPLWSLPTLRTALSRSKRSSLPGPITKGVLVLSDCARSSALSPSAERVVSPLARPDTAGLRLKASSAAETSTLSGLSRPDSFRRPLASSCSLISPLAVPSPTLISTVHRSSSPLRLSSSSVGGVMPGRLNAAVRGRQLVSKSASPS